MNTEDINLFIAISITGSLAEAARRLDISRMSVSRRLQALEEELGKTLIQRNTRSLSLTQEGIEFLQTAKLIAEAEENIKQLFSKKSAGASGILKASVPTGFGMRYVLPLLPELIKENPNLKIDLQLSDEIVDIVGRGIDIAIRVAPLRDSNLIAKKLVENPRVICASASYLKTHGAPRVLSDLNQHTCIRLSNVGHWSFQAEKEWKRVSVNGPVSCTSVEAVRELAVQGIGIAQLTYLDIKKELRQKKLVRIQLEDVSEQDLSVWAVFSANANRLARVNVFLEKIVSILRAD